MSAHKKFHAKAQNLELAVDRYMHPRMTGMHKYQENRVIYTEKLAIERFRSF